MDNKKQRSAYAIIVRLLTVLVLCVILVAGLWPFHAPLNAVSWLKDENGLRFGGHGVAVSRGPFSLLPQEGISCSLEIWLTPALVTDQGVILAFDSSPLPRMPFSLRQFGNSMAIQKYSLDEAGVLKRSWLRVDGVFHEGQRILLTITSKKGTTNVYADGVLVGQSSSFGLVGKNLTGRLVVADSTIDNSWQGEINGIAIYDRELTPAEVAGHFLRWTSDPPPTVPAGEAPTALYAFNERQGNVVHNRVDPETDLIIPTRYFVLHPAFICPLSEEFEHARTAWTHWSYWEDIIVNVAGFMPVGFVFMAYFSSVRPLQRPAWVVIMLGFALSFTVEALQWFLPTRDSGMTDVVTNTLGTALGVVFYRVSWTQALLRRMELSMIGSRGDRRGIVIPFASSPSLVTKPSPRDRIHRA